MHVKVRVVINDETILEYVTEERLAPVFMERDAGYLRDLGIICRETTDGYDCGDGSYIKFEPL